MFSIFGIFLLLRNISSKIRYSRDEPLNSLPAFIVKASKHSRGKHFVQIWTDTILRIASLILSSNLFYKFDELVPTNRRQTIVTIRKFRKFGEQSAEKENWSASRVLLFEQRDENAGKRRENRNTKYSLVGSAISHRCCRRRAIIFLEFTPRFALYSREFEFVINAFGEILEGYVMAAHHQRYNLQPPNIFSCKNSGKQKKKK